MDAGLFDLSPFFFIYRIHGGEPPIRRRRIRIRSTDSSPSCRLQTIMIIFPCGRGTPGLEIISLACEKKTACISNCFTVANFHLSKFSVAPGWKNELIENTDGTAVRARTMLRDDFPLPDAQEWAIVVYDEIFLNVNTVGNGPASGFD